MSTTECEFPPPADDEMYAKMANRRRFLKGGAALTGIVVAGLRRAEAEEPSASASRTAHADGLAYENSSAFEPSTRIGSTALFAIDCTWTEDFGLSTPLQDSVGITAPSSLHFVNSHGYLPIPTARYQSARASAAQTRPRGSPLDVGCRGSQTLALCGARSFSECNANSSLAALAAKTRNKKAATVHKTHSYTGCSEWTGVPLSLLFDQVGAYKRARLGSWPKATKQADIPKASLRLDGKARWFQSEMGPRSVTTRPFRRTAFVHPSLSTKSPAWPDLAAGRSGELRCRPTEARSGRTLTSRSPIRNLRPGLTMLWSTVTQWTNCSMATQSLSSIAVARLGPGMGKRFAYYVYPHVSHSFFDSKNPQCDANAEKLASTRTLEFRRSPA